MSDSAVLCFRVARAITNLFITFSDKHLSNSIFPCLTFFVAFSYGLTFSCQVDQLILHF